MSNPEEPTTKPERRPRLIEKVRVYAAVSDICARVDRSYEKRFHEATNSGESARLLVEYKTNYPDCVARSKWFAAAVSGIRQTAARASKPHPATGVAQPSAVDNFSEVESSVFVHSPDYRSITFEGEHYNLTPNQACIVRFMHAKHTSGFGECAQTTILKEALSLNSGRLRDSFKRHRELWGKLIVQGQRKGMYKLNLPTSGRIQ